MDLTYTDPLYLPVYSLDGIPSSLLEVTTFFFLIQLNTAVDHTRSSETLPKVYVTNFVLPQSTFSNCASGYVNRKRTRTIQW